MFREMKITWLILPVLYACVKDLSHACVSLIGQIEETAKGSFYHL